MTKSNKALKNALLLSVTLFVVLLWMLNGALPIKNIATYVSKNQKAAFLCCGGLIAFKCFASFIPTTLIYIACGYLLSPWWAFILCTVSNAVIYSVSYCESCVKNTNGNTSKKINGVFLLSFTLHCIKVLPSNYIGSFLGKSSASFVAGLLGALLGKLPSVILSLSLSGSFIFDSLPLSFLVALSLLIIISVHLAYRGKVRLELKLINK